MQLQDMEATDVQAFIRDDEIPVSWEEFDLLARKLAFKILQGGVAYDVILIIKHGATTLGALIERVLDHHSAEYARFKREETGLTVAESPPPRIVFFPSPESLKDKKVIILDEVWESGKTSIRARQEVDASDPKLVHIAVLHFKRGCNIYTATGPTYFAEEIDARYRLYPWELFERIVKAPQPSVVAATS